MKRLLQLAIACSALAAAASPGAAEPPPRPMTAANRTSGVAPLSVFFDCVDTAPSGGRLPFAWTSGVVQPADGDHEGMSYAWDFGDPGAGTWKTTGLSRNVATGYTAAHVYETPGVYAVRLTVTGKDGAVRAYAQTITVEPFSGATYYVAASGNDGNAGTDPAAPFATLARGFAALNAGPHRRLLLRRGDTFATPGEKITAPGPGIVGAYGDGPRPVLRVGGTDGGVLVTARDWRVMDLDIVGPGLTTDQGAAIGYSNVVQTVNALALRVRSTQFRVGFGNGDWKPIYATPHDGNAWVDCEVATAQVNGAYVGGRRLALLGNDIHDMVTSHVLRVWQAHKGVISNNRLWNPGPTRHALKLHSTLHGEDRPETRWVTVSDNLIRGKTWSVIVGAEDTESDERPSHVVLERNRFSGEASVQVDLLVAASDVLARNNVLDATGSSAGYTGIQVTHRGNVVPVESDVRVLHNTIARTDGSSEFCAVSIGNGVARVTARNNLAAPRTARESRAVCATGAGPGLVDDHNLLSPAPRFADAPAGDFSLSPGSPALAQGAAVPEVREDFRRRARPTGRVAAGAFEAR